MRQTEQGFTRTTYKTSVSEPHLKQQVGEKTQSKYVTFNEEAELCRSIVMQPSCRPSRCQPHCMQGNPRTYKNLVQFLNSAESLLNSSYIAVSMRLFGNFSRSSLLSCLLC